MSATARSTYASTALPSCLMSSVHVRSARSVSPSASSERTSHSFERAAFVLPKTLAKKARAIEKSACPKAASPSFCQPASCEASSTHYAQQQNKTKRRKKTERIQQLQISERAAL